MNDCSNSRGSERVQQTWEVRNWLVPGIIRLCATESKKHIPAKIYLVNFFSMNLAQAYAQPFRFYVIPTSHVWGALACARFIEKKIVVFFAGMS